MKTMTCKQLGGPCEFAHRGESADDIIKSQDQHLKVAVAGGDAVHEAALKDMKGRWKHPKASMNWYRSVKATFAGTPES
jgi:predicted small metal-binding protein